MTQPLWNEFIISSNRPMLILMLSQQFAFLLPFLYFASELEWRILDMGTRGLREHDDYQTTSGSNMDPWPYAVQHVNIFLFPILKRTHFFHCRFLLNLHFWVCDRSRGYSRRPSKLPMMHWIPIYRAPYPPPPSTPTPLSLTLAQLQTWDIWTPALPPCLWHLVAIIGDLFQFVHWTSLYRPPGTNIWWLQKYVQLASGRYASYWNAFFY